MSGRPVYVPSRKRMTKKQFFHGAFTGGFSAGYYNTVGSKEGWKPRDEEIETVQDDSNERKPQQRMEDFMDEQDHNEWGGPTAVRNEYLPSQSSAHSARPVNPILDLVVPPSDNIGHRLMRVLGWRDGSTAYVPNDSHDAKMSADMTLEAVSLSQRNLKKIQLQQTRVRLPAPKLDKCGLGYDSYQNAPEFQKDRERRRRLARERAHAVTSGDAASRNVYRLSDLRNIDEDENETIAPSKLLRKPDIEDDAHVSYETVQDFVGSKTVGGFALREDDDDVYDENPLSKTNKVNHDEYDTVIYEHDSDVEDGNSKVTGSTQELDSVLASWVKATDSTEQTPAGIGITSDGRPPLSGFVLGGSNMPTKKAGDTTRFAGPDLPVNWEVKRHEFGPDEYPRALQDTRRDVEMELMDQRREAARNERKVQAEAMAKRKADERLSKPMAGAAFSDLAAAMKDRFTTTSLDSSEQHDFSSTGLRQPTMSDKKRALSSDKPVNVLAEPQGIKIVRTVVPFVPESLLCKRLNVTAPKHVKSSVRNQAAQPTGEAAYFERNILRSTNSVPADDTGGLEKSKRPDRGPDMIDADEQQEPVEDRPPMELYKSIFEPESESSDSEDGNDVHNPPTATNNEVQDLTTPLTSETNEPVQIALELLSRQDNPSLTNHPASTALTIRDPERDLDKGMKGSSSRRRSRRDRDEHRDLKRRRKRSHSEGSVSSTSSSFRTRDRRRSREEKKKRKKHHKSSRRHKDRES